MAEKFIIADWNVATQTKINDAVKKAVKEKDAEIAELKKQIAEANASK